VSRSKPKSEPATEVRAAGGVVWRRVRRQRGRRVHEVLVVHRPRYDDWSFPKGKLDGDESDEDAAYREVLEETGLSCRLGDALGEVRYLDRRRRSKVVRYWLMEPDPASDEGAFTPNAEVDEVRWLEPADAARLLSYQHDRDLLQRLRLPRRGSRRP
jgi:8-oxo-dGTP pyrophosphatase MutT (NUDIX family)